MKFVLLVWGLSLIMSVSAEAQRQYRCSGMVQYYPCGQTLFKPRMSAGGVRPNAAKTGGDGARSPFEEDPSKYAEVTKQSYQRAGAQGWWRGTVRGNGQVHLQLQIMRNGAVESTRYMGNVHLNDKATWFSFKSPLPNGQGWSWNIRAFAS